MQVNRSPARRPTFESVRTPGAPLAALKRLHEPDYGVCIACGNDIGYERLETDPSALRRRGCARLPISARQ